MTERLTDDALEGRLRALACDAQATDGWESAAPDLIEAADRINGYAHMAADTRRLARDMAVMIDGADAAKQPALCDVAAMVRDLVKERDAHRRAAPADDLRLEVEPLKWDDQKVAEPKGLGLRYLLNDPTESDESNGWYVLEESTNTVIEADGSEQAARDAAQADFNERILTALSQPAPAPQPADDLQAEKSRIVGWLSACVEEAEMDMQEDEKDNSVTGHQPDPNDYEIAVALPDARVILAALSQNGGAA